jgi:inosine kinase
VRFPGTRVAKYYFPVTEKKTHVAPLPEEAEARRWYVTGLDEVLIDLEVHGCTYDFVTSLGLVPGESVNLAADQMRRLLERVAASGHEWRYAAGGTVANTLANFTHLSGEPAVLLGSIEATIRPGSPAFAYVAQTPKALSLEHLLAQEGDTGLAVTCFTPDGERSFGVAPGVSGQYPADAVPEAVVRESAIALASLYPLANAARPIAAATIRFLELARSANVPVAFGLGTAGLVRRMRRELIEILEAFVTVASLNVHEAEALTGESDALLASRKLLQWVDVALVTEGAYGLTLAGYTEAQVARETREALRSGVIADYNRHEFSRLVRRADCQQPLQVFTHADPYRGGPDRLANTSGAGDAALAALLHDMAANRYHRASVPDSDKHAAAVPFLTYSSASRNAQYANRVAYEVLRNRSPRLEGPVGSDEE